MSSSYGSPEPVQEESCLVDRAVQRSNLGVVAGLEQMHDCVRVTEQRPGQLPPRGPPRVGADVSP
jgi:hypothetical protein